MNKNTKHIFAAFLILYFALPVKATHDLKYESVKPVPVLPVREITIKQPSKMEIAGLKPESVPDQQFFFKEFESQIANFNMPVIMPPDDNFMQFLASIGNGKVSAAVKRADQIIDKAIEVGNKIDLLTGGDLVKMPIYKTQMIGQTEFTIVFNSAKIHPQYAEIEVFAKVELPQKDFNGNQVVLYFAADNILFSQEKGIIKGNLGLLADFAIVIGEYNASDPPKGGVWLSKRIKGAQIAGQNTTSTLDDDFLYTGTFINFDCEGFKEMGVGGRAYFSREWVIPADEIGDPLEVPNDDKSLTPRTYGTFQIIAQDWNDILVSVNITDPFILTKWKNTTFEFKKAHLDLSAYRNPTGIPIEYNIEPNLWEGLYIDTISIMLPKPFKRVKEPISEAGAPPQDENYPLPERERIKISAAHLLIDEAGVSGKFAAYGQVPLIGGALMDGEWGISLDEIYIDLVQSDITRFEFSGELGAPIFSKEGPLDYNGELLMPEPGNHDADSYSFTIGGIAENATIPIWNAANLNIGYTTLGVEILDDEFHGTLTIATLSLTIGNEKDYASSQTGSSVKMPSVTITDLKLSTRAPRFSFGSLEILIGENKMMGFPVTITGYNLSSPLNNPDQLIFGFTLELNLMSQNENGATASGDFKIIGDYKRDINGATHWHFNKFAFEGAEVEVSMPQVYAHGTLCLFEDDPNYGKGFYANVEARIIGEDLWNEENGKFKLNMMAIFGSTNSYRYFMVDGFLGGDAINVPLFGPFYLDGFGGGVFHNMRPYAYLEEGTESPDGVCANATSTSDIVYRPNPETRFGLQFATSISTTGNLMKGLLTCIIRFDQNMALQNITFWGVADIMVKSELSDRVIADVDKLHAKVHDNLLTPSQVQAKAEQEAFDPNIPPEENGIKAKLGLSLDFANGFTFHGFADVSIVVYDVPGEPGANIILQGRGTIDLLLSDKDWHFYLGGFYTNQGADITVPNFFNPEDFITLEPVNVYIDYNDFTVSANAYFLTGNTILPGPPPPAPEVVAFFGPESTVGNRDLLNCSPNTQAMGTGIAFGASAFFDFSAFKKGIFGSCLLGLKVNVSGGVGFDLALLKFNPETICSLSGDTPHGLNGFRAGGRVFIFINLEGQQVTCLPIPPLAVGLKIRFDVPNPSYFQVVAIIRIGKEFKFKANIGEECGAPCVSTVELE